MKIDEHTEKQMDNLFSPKGKKCSNCHWSTYEKGDNFITCGVHIDNFSSNSFCSSWTELKPTDKSKPIKIEKQQCLNCEGESCSKCLGVGFITVIKH